MSILDYGCNCNSCLQNKKNLLNESKKQWDKGIRNIVFKPYHSTCSDGCCDEYGTNVSINGFEMGADGENTESVLRDVFEFLQIDNVSIDYDDSENYEIGDYDGY